jgi:Tfp pilus assembly protein PilV
MTPRGRQHGAALIEVMVAVVIFVAVSAGLTSSTINAKRTADGSRHAAEATTLAFDKIEQLRTQTSGSGELTSGSHSDTANPLNTNSTGGGIFTRSWTVSTNLPSLTPALMSGTLSRIDMRVSWPNPNGGNGSVTLVSYFRQ